MMHQVLKNMLHAIVLKSKLLHRKSKALHRICLQKVLGKIFDFPDRFSLFKFVVATTPARANTPTSKRYITAQPGILYMHYKYSSKYTVYSTIFGLEKY